jgi:hypothetical protein
MRRRKFDAFSIAAISFTVGVTRLGSKLTRHPGLDPGSLLSEYSMQASSVGKPAGV